MHDTVTLFRNLVFGQVEPWKNRRDPGLLNGHEALELS